MADALTGVAIPIAIALVEVGAAFVRAVVPAEGRLTHAVRANTLAMPRAGSTREALQLTTVVTREAWVAEAGSAMAQSVAAAMVGAAADGAVLAAESMITQALAVLCAFAIDAAHGACIATAVCADEALIAGAHAVVAVAVSRANKAKIVGGASAHVARRAAPARHALALAVVADAMTRAVLGAVFLPAIFPYKPLIALAFHVNALAVIRASIWTCRKLACLALPAIRAKAGQVTATLLLKTVASPVAVRRARALAAIHAGKPWSTCTAHGCKITCALRCGAGAPAVASALFAAATRESLLAYARPVLAKAVAVAIVGTLGRRPNSFVTQDIWVAPQGVGEARVTSRPVAVLLIVERDIIDAKQVVRPSCSITTSGRYRPVEIRIESCLLDVLEGARLITIDQDGVNDRGVLRRQGVGLLERVRAVAVAHRVRARCLGASRQKPRRRHERTPQGERPHFERLHPSAGARAASSPEGKLRLPPSLMFSRFPHGT